MYMSKIELDMNKPKTTEAIARPIVMHGITENAFSGTREHPLYRIDTREDGTFLYIVSKTIPDGASIVHQIGSAEKSWQVKDYDPFLSDIEAGKTYSFTLTANTAVTVGEKGQRRRAAVNGRGNRREWLIKRSEHAGFSIKKKDFWIVKEEWLTCGNRENSAPFIAVTFEGCLTVTDADKFRTALCAGIGHEKAYGCGLLTCSQK